MPKILTCLWYERDGEAAARLYTRLLPDSRIDAVHTAPADFPGGSAGDVLLVDFTLMGAHFQALNGGMPMAYSNAASISVEFEHQAEVDRLWDALLAEGGRAEACGWLRDRWDVPWQIVPAAMSRIMADPDPEVRRRGFTAMMDMVKLDGPALERAARGG